MVCDFLTDNNSQELYKRMQNYINEFRNEKHVDYIIILGHLGIYGDTSEENSSSSLLKNIEGVDAFLDGHSHEVYSESWSDKNINNINLAQTGTKLANIEVLIIKQNEI